MSQRNSGYLRRENDLYETPAWVTHALRDHLPHLPLSVWEPASGSGKMADALREWGIEVVSTDISWGADFFEFGDDVRAFAIITNPPYVQASAFIRRALKLTSHHGGMVAMLLRTDFDHAQSRSDLFRRCPQFAKKVVLTKRIKWFEDSKGQPSFNHAWYVWNWRHSGAPTLAYA